MWYLLLDFEGISELAKVDLSWGFGQLSITVEVSKDGMPLSPFYYIIRNIVFDKAPVNPYLKILSADVRCATCKADCYEDLEPCECPGEMQG